MSAENYVQFVALKYDTILKSDLPRHKPFIADSARKQQSH